MENYTFIDSAYFDIKKKSLKHITVTHCKTYLNYKIMSIMGIPSVFL